MKILVFSDSHRTLSFMRTCIEKIGPDAMIHLGDHYADGENIHMEYPDILFYQVPGNCDFYSCPPFARPESSSPSVAFADWALAPATESCLLLSHVTGEA